ncbi:MAG: B12-binding domain-containing radical SAM protein [Epulopiscium sp.]|nr:B12-binding domain-containing radical SAM protein [Candidatus Epulonipiscium sp.]
MDQNTKDILLVALNAKFIHSSLALRSLRAYCSPYKDKISIAEYTINHHPDFILREIYKQKPKIIGFSCYIWNIEYVLSLVSVIKQIMPKTMIFLGGPEVSYDSEFWLREHKEVDFIIQGEGEETLYELIQYFYKEGKIKTLEEIKGICYRQGDKIYEGPSRFPLNLNTIPFVYDSNEFKELKNRIIYYESSRGCPYQCQYCLSSVEQGVRYLSLDRVFSDLQQFLNHKVKQVKFVDRTFNCNPDRALAIWKYLKEHDNGITNFHFEISADILKPSILDFLSTVRKKQFQFEIGVQSTHSTTIEYIRRKMDFKELSEVVKTIQAGHNIHQHLDLIAGLPGESYRRFQQSFNDVYDLQPEKLQLGFLKLLRGSGLRRDANKYGLIYQKKAPYEILSTAHLSYGDLLKLKMIEEMVEIYYNGGKFLNSMRYLLFYFSHPFEMYEELAAYWEKQNYHAIQHNKYRLYEILLEFFQEKNPTSNVALFKEVLKFDMYLQENVKSPPQWSTSSITVEEKQKIRDFFKEENMIQTYLPQLQEYTSKQIGRMVHIEIFEYDWINWIDQWQEKEPKKIKTPILFNYYDRSHVLGQAGCCKVPL